MQETDVTYEPLSDEELKRLQAEQEERLRTCKHPKVRTMFYEDSEAVPEAIRGIPAMWACGVCSRKFAPEPVRTLDVLRTFFSVGPSYHGAAALAQVIELEKRLRAALLEDGIELSVPTA